MNGFLFKVANPAMARMWRDQICKEVKVEEDCLASGNNQAVEDAGIPQFQEEEEVHTLVLSFLK